MKDRNKSYTCYTRRRFFSNANVLSYFNIPWSFPIHVWTKKQQNNNWHGRGMFLLLLNMSRRIHSDVE